MTIKELSQLQYLNKEISLAKQKLSELQSLASGTTIHVTGLPHVGTISNKTAIATEIADIKDWIEYDIRQSLIEYKKISEFIHTLDDSLLRQIMILRFIDGLKWRDIAQKIGGGNSEEGIRKMLWRYLKKTQK